MYYLAVRGHLISVRLQCICVNIAQRKTYVGINIYNRIFHGSGHFGEKNLTNEVC